MIGPELYLSIPRVNVPASRVTNDDVVARVQANFRGDDATWRRIERTIRFVFTTCGTKVRYAQLEQPHAAGTHAANVAAELLAEHGLSGHEVDALVYASIVREYFEPAVATEVAWRLGANRALAFDVVAACAGPIVAIDTLRGRAVLDPDWQVAVVSTASLNDGFIGFDIQDPAQLDVLAAGLTIGQAMTATLVGRKPFAHGGRIVGSYVEGAPGHHPLCQAPLFGVFRSAGSALFALAELVPGHVERACARVGWKVGEVDMFVFHQPSDRILREIAGNMGVQRDRMPGLHHLYGNTEASAVPLTLRHLADEGRLRPGMKVLLGSAAAGFIIGTVAVEWMS